MNGPSHDFWQTRFATGQLPWDRGTPNPQLLRWLEDDVLTPGSRVVVPGCGQGWEVAALAAAGMNVVGLDFAPGAVALCRQLLDRQRLTAELTEANVLHWRPESPVDAIFEQTCLCALYPDYWAHYAAQLHAWLKPGGRLLAMFMQVSRPEGGSGVIAGPPYHCDINAMRAMFPATLWAWPKPPYPQVVQDAGLGHVELAVILARK